MSSNAGSDLWEEPVKLLEGSLWRQSAQTQLPPVQPSFHLFTQQWMHRLTTLLRTKCETL